MMLGWRGWGEEVGGRGVGEGLVGGRWEDGVSLSGPGMSSFQAARSSSALTPGDLIMARNLGSSLGSSSTCQLTQPSPEKESPKKAPAPGEGGRWRGIPGRGW